MPAPRTRLLVAVVLSVLLAAGIYLASTTGLEAIRASGSAPSAIPPRVPDFVHQAPETVPTDRAYGPPGRVALVFPGTDVETGLFDELARPWIAVSATNGEYRALDAPHLPAPAPDVVAVSHAGDLLAWGHDAGVTVYDALTGQTRELGGGLAGPVRAVSFSRDARHLAAYDGSLHVLDTRSGEVVATLGGIAEEVARHAVWTPDGEALTYVEDGDLVRHEWRTDRRTRVRADIDARFGISWNGDGSRLATMREERGVRFVEVLGVRRDGSLSEPTRLRPDGYAQQDLVGFSGDRHVAVLALRSETGPSDFVYDLPLDGGPPTMLTQLPARGLNWHGAQHLELAPAALAGGSQAFPEPSWPWSDRSKLTFSVLAAVFVLGLYLTRPENRATRRWLLRRRG